MTLQNLKYMIEISNCKSFSKAAKNLFISQSTLSSAMKELESDLGITIFKRTNRGVSLTYDGEDFIKYAREIVEQSQYLEQRYHARKSLPMRFSVSCQHLSSAVRAFTQFLSEVESDSYDIAIRECDTNSVIHDVAGRKSELGIVAIHDSHIRSMQTLFSSYDIEFHEIKSIKNYVFLRFGHPLSSLPVLSIKDLETYPFVTYDQELETSHFSEEPLFYKLLNKNVHVCDRCTKIALVRKTNCFSIGPDLPNSNADAFHKEIGNIIAKPLDNDIGLLHIGYLTISKIPVSTLGKLYLEYLSKDIDTLSILDKQ
mgnify:CR=1 FL=1